MKNDNHSGLSLITGVLLVFSVIVIIMQLLNYSIEMNGGGIRQDRYSYER